jgi:hypothetical protein
MSDKERQAAKRARDKAIADGTYIKTPLELAKEFLATQDDPDIKSLSMNNEISQHLTDDQRKQLISFITNLRHKRKKE